MVWGGIMNGQKTRLIVMHGNLNAQRYINEILNAEAIPFMQRNGTVVFQQDNARPHTARITRARLAAVNVNTIQWPAISPDMGISGMYLAEMSDDITPHRISSN
jgi:hypothetical protein